MSEQNKPTPQNEEVDLGQLFKILGNTFQKIFGFLNEIFKGLFKILILFLAHLIQTAKWYALAVIIGLMIGYFLDKSAQREYTASMFIETKFNSSRQVYEVIKDFNQLASSENDKEEVARRLGIPKEKAESLKGFDIEADIDENKLVKSFVDFKKGLDSVAKEEYNFKEYKEAQADYNFSRHKITVVSTNQFIFKDIEDKLISEFLTNDYIKNLVRVNLENLDKLEKTIDSEIEELNALVKTYLEIRQTEAKKEFKASQGTNFYISGTEKSELIKDEAALVNKIYQLEKEKQSIAVLRVENLQQVNLISGFSDSGYEIYEWYDKKTLVMPIAFILILFLFFTSTNFVKFVKAQNV